MVDAVFGGLVGALLATVVQLWFERRKLKHELMRDVMHWMSEAFHHVVDLWTHDDFRAKGDANFLADSEIRHIRRDLDRLMTPAELRARVAAVFGEPCRQLQLMDDFVTEAQSFMRIFTASDTGAAPDPRNRQLARIMADLRAAFIRAAKMPWVRAGGITHAGGRPRYDRCDD